MPQQADTANRPTPRNTLPALLMGAAARPVPAGQGAASSFVSQLIAERQHLPPQRERRRAPVAVAVGSYRQAAELAVLRLPPGYRRMLVV